MAQIGLGGLNPGQSFDSKSQKINGADAGTEIWGYCTDGWKYLSAFQKKA